MFGKKKREEESKRIMAELDYKINVTTAYINELRRKDGKYNFVFMPYVSVAEDKYSNLYSYGKNDPYSKGYLIRFLYLNDKLVKFDFKDQIQLSLKSGKYKLRIVVDADLNLLNNVSSYYEKQNPGVTFHTYKDEYLCEIDRTCEFVVNDNDIAYVLFKGKVTPKYSRSKNLLFMDSYSHSYEMRQTSIEHIKSMIPNAYVFDDLRFQYENVDQYYIDEAYKLHGDELSKYKDVEIKPVVSKTINPTLKVKQIILKYPNGNEYVGETINDIPNGKGIYYYKSGVNTGCSIDGNFLNGKIDGLATIRYKDGSYYIGQFKENLKHGKGTLYKKDGSQEHLEYINGKLKTPVNEIKPVTTTSKPKIISSTNATSNKSTTSTNNISKPKVNETIVNKNTKPVNVRYEDKITFPNGDFYVGSMLNGKFDGHGKMYYKDGRIYDGEWKDGKRHGKASYRNPEIEYFVCEFIDDKPTKHCVHTSYYGVYEGEWENFKINGKGTFTSKNGDKYVGEFKNGEITGKGIFTYSNGDKYEGNLINGIYEGYGKLINKSGSSYEGEFKNGKYHGKGTYIYSDKKTKYEGEFVNGKFEGYGKYYSNGALYEGQFKDDLLNGKGKVSYDDGTYLEGEFINNKCNGKGIKIYPNKDKYEGDFLYDALTGYGKFTFNNGNKYEGEVYNGFFNGKGTFYYVNGNRYEGYFKNGSWHGKGKLYYNDGQIEEMLYENNNFVSKRLLNEREPSNIYDFSAVQSVNYNDCFYVGELLKNNPNGFGIMLYQNGNYFIGQFEKGKILGLGLYVDINNNKVYCGRFKDLTLNGAGLEINANNTASFGNFFEGELVDEVRFIDNMKYLFNQNKFTINMTLNKMDGVTYFGGILDNYFHMAGVLCFNNGIKYIGQYEYGYYNGIGVLSYPDGSFYIGMFEKGFINGYGMLVNDDGIKIGMWKENLFIK